jgi:hypothetical protein
VGTADEVSLSSTGSGVFVTVASPADTLAPACPLVSTKFHGFQCPAPASVRIDAGAGRDVIDAARLAVPLHVTGIADGVRDVVACGSGQDVVDGVADPNDDIAASCETAQRSFASARLPTAVTMAAPSTVTLAIGSASVPLRFTATMSTAPPKHGKHAPARLLARASAPAGTGAVSLRFVLPKVSKGFLSKRPSIRVQVAVTAIAADGRRYPLQLHAQNPGSHPKLVTLHDNQVRLVIPERLRHPR